MSINKIKDLFFEATNSKIVMGLDVSHSERLLRKALNLSKGLEDQVWPYITAYRLAHILFRNAQMTSELTEIFQLAEYSENSSSEYIKFHSKLIKFAAIDRLRRSGSVSFEEKLKETQLEIVQSIYALQQVKRGASRLESDQQSIQDNQFNYLEYMTYMAGIDYAPLLGVGYNDKNTLFPDGINDVWQVIGPHGYTDRFSYNHEIGLIELDRIVREKEADGWYVLGATGIGNELHADNNLNSDANTQRIVILNEIIKSGALGIKASKLASLIAPQHYESDFDFGSREKPGESMVKKHRAKITKIIGKDIFMQTSGGRSGTSWALTNDAKVYGLVNQKHLC